MFATLLLLAQDGGGQGKDSGPFGGPFGLLPIILIFVVFYLVVILPGQRRERKQREALLNALKKNDKVLTSSGIIGIVSSIKDKEDEVTLKLEEGRMRVLRSSIVKIFGAETPTGDPKQQEAGKTS